MGEVEAHPDLPKGIRSVCDILTPFPDLGKKTLSLLGACTQEDPTYHKPKSKRLLCFLSKSLSLPISVCLSVSLV